MKKQLLNYFIYFFVIIISFLHLTWANTVSSQSSKKYNKVLHIPKLEFQEINSWYGLYLKSAIEKAKEENHDLIILEIDTPGGRVDITEKIVNYIISYPHDVIVYINHNALSAGALISLTAGTIFIKSGGTIGAATPVTIKNGAVEKAPEKINSALRGKFRSMAEKNNRPIKICEAMVDESIVLTKEENGIELSKDKLLTLSSKEALKTKLVDYIIDDIEEIYQILGIENKDISIFSITGQLELLRYIGNPVFLSILLSLGLIGIFSEIRSPGWGVGGTLAVVFLTTYFIIQMITLNSDWKAPAFFFLGVFLILMELFIIPGFGISGVLGIFTIIVSLVLGFGWENISIGLWSFGSALLISTVFFILSFFLFPESKFFKQKWALNSGVNTKKEFFDEQKHDTINERDQGLVIAALRPWGKVKINDEIIEARSEENNFIKNGSKVVVTQKKDNKIIVKKV